MIYNKSEDINNNYSKRKVNKNKTFLILEILGNIDKYEVSIPKIEYFFKWNSK